MSKRGIKRSNEDVSSVATQEVLETPPTKQQLTEPPKIQRQATVNDSIVKSLLPDLNDVIVLPMPVAKQEAWDEFVKRIDWKAIETKAAEQLSTNVVEHLQDFTTKVMIKKLSQIPTQIKYTTRSTKRASLSSPVSQTEWESNLGVVSSRWVVTSTGFKLNEVQIKYD
jgi:hypothetical protein